MISSKILWKNDCICLAFPLSAPAHPPIHSFIAHLLSAAAVLSTQKVALLPSRTARLSSPTACCEFRGQDLNPGVPALLCSCHCPHLGSPVTSPRHPACSLRAAQLSPSQPAFDVIHKHDSRDLCQSVGVTPVWHYVDPSGGQKEEPAG